MSVATSTAIGIAGAIGAAGAVGGAAISSSAAGKAASTQADAAKSAAQLQAQEAQNSLDFQKQEWNTQQQNLAPWLSAGKGALGNLQAILALPNQGFTPPTAAEAAKYPGYQFQLEQGKGALENSAAAKGALYSGNTQEALVNYAEQAGQSDYTNVYNQAFQMHNDRLNRLAAMAGVGQTAGTTLGQQGQAAASNVANISLTSGAQQGQDIQNAAAAQASGYIGGANAWSGALSGGANNFMNLMMLQRMGLFGSGDILGSASNLSNAGNLSPLVNYIPTP
jgi:hypothetical protein